MQKNPSHVVQGRILQADYDRVFTAEGAYAPCLTMGEIEWILSQVEYAAWWTRWFSPTGADIDRDLIEAFASNLARKLIVNLKACSEDTMYRLRQNEENPCLLEQSEDGGITWSEAFDYSLCLASAGSAPILERYDGEYYDYQQSYDGGATWQTVPDYRIKSPMQKNNNLTKPDPACYASQQVVEWVRESAEIDDESTFITIVGVLLQLVLVFVTGGALAPMLITTIANAIIQFGIAEFKAAMDGLDYDLLLCTLTCNADAEGRWSLQAWYAILDQIPVDYPGITGDFIRNMFTALGWVGLNNVAQAGYDVSEECDCDCDAWCYTFDFEAVSGGFAAQDSYGTWIGGTGWRYTDVSQVQAGILTANRQVFIEIDIATTILTRVNVVYDFTGGSYDNSSLNAMAILLDDGAVVNLSRSGMSNGDDQIAEWTNDGASKSKIGFVLRSSRDISAPLTYSGNAVIKSMTIEGIGTNPFGADNCP